MIFEENAMCFRPARGQRSESWLPAVAAASAAPFETLPRFASIRVSSVPLVFPVHPRTRKALEAAGYGPQGRASGSSDVNYSPLALLPDGIPMEDALDLQVQASLPRRLLLRVKRVRRDSFLLRSCSIALPSSIASWPSQQD